MSIWKALTVSELESTRALLVQDGNHGEYRPRRSEFQDSGTAFIRAADIDQGRILFASAQKISPIAQSRIRKGVGAPLDAILSHKGTVGKVAFAPVDSPPYVCSPQTTFWRSTDHTRIDPRYLYFFLQSPMFISQLRSRENESDMAAYVSLTQQRKLRVIVPPINVQQAIAIVLGALDDKIAVNHAISTTALALADSVFESFASEVETGPNTFASVADVFGGGTPRTSEPGYWDGEFAWATPTDVTALSSPYLFRTKRTITDSGLSNCASRLYPAGSIFMTSRATIGAFAIPQIPAAVNQGFIVVIPPRNNLRWWLFHEMRSRVDDMISLANGSTFLELSRKNFKAMPIRLGSGDAIERFDTQVDPLHKRAEKSAEESRTLTQLRDILLPKLMSGEIRVRDAERTVEDAV